MLDRLTQKEFDEICDDIRADADEIYGSRGYGWELYVGQQISQLRENCDIVD